MLYTKNIRVLYFLLIISIFMLINYILIIIFPLSFYFFMVCFFLFFLLILPPPFLFPLCTARISPQEPPQYLCKPLPRPSSFHFSGLSPAPIQSGIALHFLYNSRPALSIPLRPLLQGLRPLQVFAPLLRPLYALITAEISLLIAKKI